MPQLRRYLRWAVRIVGGIFCLVVVGLAIGALYQAIAGNVDETRYKSPGRLVDIGGRRLHLYCTGQGSPTVILEAGLGWGLGTWRNVQPSVSQTTQVCSYDRAGYGWSDVGPSPRTSSQVSSDLHTLLQKAGVHPPLVLVGHSLGGLYVQHYAATFPAEVSGMVLVDSSHEDQGNDPPSRLFLLAMKGLGASGLGRFFIRYGDSSMNAMYSSNKTIAATIEELAVVTKSADELRKAHLSLGNKPLIVLTAGRNDSDDSWHRMQLDLLTRSSNSQRIVVDNSGHRIQNDRPDEVIAAIRDVVEGSRHP
jgi:pimeloyl-ACP methyl ester carboxylesterase